MTTALRWGILGAARINRALIPALRAAPRSELVAVASRNDEKAAAHAREWSIPRWHGSYEKLLADPEIDAIYIPLPNHLHAYWTVAAARAGKHVLCEKPLALSTGEVDEISDAAARAGVTAAEAFMVRSHPQTLRVRELVAGGAVGRLQLIRGTFTFMLDRPADVRWDPTMGGGSLWDVGCYPVTYARLVTGAEPVAAHGWQVLSPSGVDETFAGELLFPGGVVAQIFSGFRTSYRPQIHVVGSEGTLEVHEPFRVGPGARIELRRGDSLETFSAPEVDAYVAELEDFAAAVLERRPPRVSLDDSRGNVAAILALLESARTGRVVHLG